VWMPNFGGEGMADAYFLVGLWVLAGLLFGGLCAQKAVTKGLRPVGWFFAGLFLLAPAYAVLVLCACGPGAQGREHTRAPLACEACGHLNHPAAEACSGCGAQLAPGTPSEVNHAR